MKLFIVIPCYNEEEVLPTTIERMLVLRQQIKSETSAETKLLFVDDGSKDATWQIIHDASAQYDCILGVKLARNRGHQNALWAGMEQCCELCDAMVSIDADLQDDENAIIEMVKKAQTGVDIVYGVRKERKTDTWFKRFTAQAFYRLMKSVDPDIIYNHADFRLMSQRSLRALLSYGERNLFLRGIVRELGFREACVYYDRKAREAGESKYPLRKMLSFSLDGITSFSVAPIKFIALIGLLMTLASIVLVIYYVYQHAIGKTLPGWTSLMVSLWFIGGCLMLSLGTIGVYVGKIYTEVKQRPRYFIDEKVGF